MMELNARSLLFPNLITCISVSFFKAFARLFLFWFFQFLAFSYPSLLLRFLLRFSTVYFLAFSSLSILDSIGGCVEKSLLIMDFESGFAMYIDSEAIFC